MRSGLSYLSGLNYLPVKSQKNKFVILPHSSKIEQVHNYATLNCFKATPLFICTVNRIY